MQIVELKLDELTPFENNAKIHTDKDVDVIANSIKEFGMNDPIGIWGDKNIIVEGHGRLLALKKLGYEKVPCIRLDHLTDEQRRMYTLTHNKSAELSEWDFEKLEQEMKQLEFELSNFGFDEKELQIEFDKNKETEEDDFDVEENIPEEATVKRGQLYKLGNHYLLCGDSTCKEDVEKLMQGNKADLVFTDPPYGMNLDTDYSSMKTNLQFMNDKGKIKGNKYAQGFVDEFKPQLIKTVFDNFGYCKEIFLFGADYFAELLENKNNGSWIVWDKRLDESADKGFGSNFELCWSKNKHKREIARVKWFGLFGMEQEFDKKRHHPTQKPIKLVEWFLNKYSDEKNKVVDLYGGSGSTLIACEQMNRQCFMLELDEKYCDVIIKRYERLTGQKAVLVD